jgi:ubiquinone/menaquinone biosynthesis C-methylase UbiE
MQRIPEPDLMDDPAQARAYAAADFEQAHNQFIVEFRRCFPHLTIPGCVLDLGCGPCDITRRFARAYPDCTLHAVDGAAQMLKLGAAMLEQTGLVARISLIQARLPEETLPRTGYDAVISNSLLHHLADPQALWQSITRHARPGAPVFIMDLSRPDSTAAARALMEQYAVGEPEILRQDFYNSLCAAYRIEEVAAQLRTAGLGHLSIEIISDRHFIVHGFMTPLQNPASPE